MNQLLISIQKQWCSPKGNCTNNPWGPWRTIESFHETADPLNVDSTPRFSPTHLPHLLPPDPAPSGVVTAASRQEGTCGAGPLRNQLCFSGALEGITVKWKKHGKKHMVACRGLSFRFQDLSLSWFTWLHFLGPMALGHTYFSPRLSWLIAATAGSKPGTNKEFPENWRHWIERKQSIHECVWVSAIYTVRETPLCKKTQHVQCLIEFSVINHYLRNNVINNDLQCN